MNESYVAAISLVFCSHIFLLLLRQPVSYPPFLLDSRMGVGGRNSCLDGTHTALIISRGLTVRNIYLSVYQIDDQLLFLEDQVELVLVADP
jgi:hypothetical protein